MKKTTTTPMIEADHDFTLTERQQYDLETAAYMMVHFVTVDDFPDFVTDVCYMTMAAAFKRITGQTYSYTPKTKWAKMWPEYSEVRLMQDRRESLRAIDPTERERLDEELKEIYRMRDEAREEVRRMREEMAHRS